MYVVTALTAACVAVLPLSALVAALVVAAAVAVSLPPAKDWLYPDR